jgi:putative endonuclease
MPHFVYILKSISSDKHYFGETKDLIDRLKRHNQNRSKATKKRGPWKLVTSIQVNTKSEACKLERKLKNMKNPSKTIEYLERLNAQL